MQDICYVNPKGLRTAALHGYYYAWLSTEASNI